MLFASSFGIFFCSSAKEKIRLFELPRNSHFHHFHVIPYSLLFPSRQSTSFSFLHWAARNRLPREAVPSEIRAEVLGVAGTQGPTPLLPNLGFSSFAVCHELAQANCSLFLVLVLLPLSFANTLGVSAVDVEWSSVCLSQELRCWVCISMEISLRRNSALCSSASKDTPQRLYSFFSSLRSSLSALRYRHQHLA